MAKKQPAKNSSKAATTATNTEQEELAKAAAAHEETTNATSEPAAYKAQENAQLSEEPVKEGDQEQPDVTQEKPEYDLSPEQQSEQQKEYVVQFNRYIDLHDGQMPDANLSAEELAAENEKKEQENAQPPAAEKAVTAAPAKAKEAKSDKTHVMLKHKKTGEIRRLKRVTWELLKKSPGGFEEIKNVPQEVKNLKKGGK